MTDAQNAYGYGPNNPMLLFFLWRAQVRPTLLGTLLGAADRLFHLMDPGKFEAAQPASPTVTAAQREFMARFHTVIVPHIDAAYNFARFLSRDPDAAQDIVQESFLRAYRNFESYRGGDPKAWLFAIVRNCCHAWRQYDRRKARFERHLGSEADQEVDDRENYQIAADDDSPETTTIRRNEQQRVRTVIAGLPEAAREILVLRELEDLSYRQIAEILDAPIGTVMSRLARARREFGEAWDLYCNNETGR
jgi:RNA polymerase sigma factor (sigma-70 family)